MQNVFLEEAKIEVCDILSVLKLLFLNKNIKKYVFCKQTDRVYRYQKHDCLLLCTTDSRFLRFNCI